MQKFEHSLARVAVWNLAGFGGIPAARRKRQALGLALLDAELVTLVEVNPASYIEELAADLAAYGVHYDTTLIPQPHGNLHIGLLHKRGVEVTNAQLIPGTEGSYANGRRALRADIRIGKFSAVLLGVHLKSGRGRAEQIMRDTQCAAIGGYLTQLRATSPHKRRALILMGDFNMIPGQDVSNFHHLGGDDLMDFVSCWDLQDRFSHILDAGRANLLDGFAVSRTYATDYVRGSLRLFPMHWTLDMGREKFKRTVSDHLPFVASFRVF
ncbi:GMP synthase [Alphaproteobacteria bacterium KMM 3653]|uniref:GMP synthase n=1 Tax=Harenicola maris TaxID=2841044 RepID=A0AAP2CLV8_9RHOB|nr:GMP synthase [Harenicola maris]